MTKIFGSVLDALAGGRREINMTGLWGSSKALFLWELASVRQAPVVVVSPTPKESETLFKDFCYFAAGLAGVEAVAQPLYFPPWDVLPYDVMDPDQAVVARRLRALRDIAKGRAKVAFVPVNAFMQKLPHPDALLGEASLLKFYIGAEFDHEALLTKLVKLGYSRTATVYEPGEFSVRGGILDIFPPGLEKPVRVEFFGDSVESMRPFEPDTQRSSGTVEEFTAIPAKEVGDAAVSLESDLTRYFNVPPVVVVDEPDRVNSLARDFEAKVFSSYEAADGRKAPPDSLYLGAEGLDKLFGSYIHVSMCSLPLEGAGGDGFVCSTRSIEALRLREVVPEPWPEELPKTPISIFCRNLKGLLKGRAVNVATPTKGQAERLREIFAEYGVPAVEGSPVLEPGQAEGAARITIGELSSGFLIDEPPLAFITATEIFGEKPRHGPAPRAKVERFLTSLSELSIGDYVVHVDHGIGRYMGLKRLKLMGVEADFLEVVYAGADRLYVPVDELVKVQKYIGAEGSGPSLEKLGGVGWERAKVRAKKAVAEIAKELLELYAARSVAPGFAYSPDDHLYREMEASFEYDETPDQARSIEEVKADLEKPHPMDRLVCGDVGYGKTEVAVRAAFKVVLDGKQAAVLVPTTLLADQHFKTFTSRLAAFPVRVEMLSRFTPKPHIKEVLKGMAEGTVDMVIGTHRLLQKDVKFHDLGLIVIDEEHRFGVAHKEKLKHLRKQVDVLTLTATPIPRTLNMSISGIRDLSIIETAPPDRQPIKTVVSRFDKTVIREAITRELMRGGQVFFVHNRIDSIFAVGSLLKSIVPDARIGVAHGRMHEDMLEDVMKKFIAAEYDVLLATSIIESGLDIPAANTIIIDRADRFGLADLYQLRGRVGRASDRGYAYLLVPGEDTLSETAQKRLRVLTELTELGAGFKLALHDLEIRGAGNILGAEQSGQISAIGFELYTRLLEDAVKELKGEAVEEDIDPALDLKVSAYIPEQYIPETSERLSTYKRLAGARSEEEIDAICGELKDRYGQPPAEAARLLEVMGLKVLAKVLKVGGIQLMPSEVKITFTDKVDIDPDRLVRFLGKRRGFARYVPQYTLFIKKPSGGWETLHSEIKNSLKELAGM